MASFAIWLCLVLTILSAGYSAAVSVSCESRLRILFPHLFKHCDNPAPCAYGPWGKWLYTGVLKNDSTCHSGLSRQQNRTRTVSTSTPACESQLRPEKQERQECAPCDYGPWGRWLYIGVFKTNQTCITGKAGQYNRTRTASTTACESQLGPEKQVKYECEPTMVEKATLIITSLRLGSEAKNPTINPSQPTLPLKCRKRRRLTLVPKLNISSHDLDGLAEIVKSMNTTRKVLQPLNNTEDLMIDRWRPLIMNSTAVLNSIIANLKLDKVSSSDSIDRVIQSFLCLRRRRSFDSVVITMSRSSRQVPTYGYCPTNTKQQNNRVCRNIGCNSPIGKRSINKGFQETHWGNVEKTEGTRFFIDKEPNPDSLKSLDPSILVEEFDLDKYIYENRRNKRQIKCSNSTHNATVRYVLFIVDTSGSVGRANFDAVKEIIANISDALCDHLKFALLTYNHFINLEFCFKCYNDRRDIREAILRTRYRGGATYTTDAIKCSCDEILTQPCGLPQGIDTPNIDVVLLTDGSHNGPCRNALKETVKCLHNRDNINTFGIGIGQIDYESVRELTNGEGTNIFRVETFTELQQLFMLIQDLLKTEDGNGNPVYSCAAHDAQLCGKPN